MAERRMFAKTIIDSDTFLDMPQSSQLLYFHLSMRADDEGFINNPRSIMRNAMCSEEDIACLIKKEFIISFESGIVAIKHWKIHNYIAKDRFKATKYKEERAKLSLDDNNSYTECTQNVCKTDTQVRLGKVKLGKFNILSASDEADGKIEEIINYLNKKTGKSFRATSKKNKTCIKARLNEEYTVQDFKTVIDNKVLSWLNDSTMNRFLRPETLFGDKFDSYLNEKAKKCSFDISTYEKIAINGSPKLKKKT